MNSSPIQIGNFTINDKSPTFIVAELSANHNQDFDIAIKTIKAAKECGADAIKLQTYTPDTITLDCQNEYFQINQGTLWDGTTLYQLYQKAYTPWEWQPKLKQYAEELGLACFSSPFDKSAVDFLENMNVPAYKIASFEIVDIPLIEYTASKGKPVIISTGIALEDDIQEAIDACKRMNNNQIILLKCTSEYPTPVEDANLNSIHYIRKKFGLPVGLSDHTLETTVPIAAVALGACMIEKHLIFDKTILSPDAKFSLTPDLFKEMVDSVRYTEKALGKSSLFLSKKVLKSKEHSRSLFAVKDIKEGELFTEDNIKSIRPAFGLHPKYLKDLLGNKSKREIKRGTPLNYDDLK
ncbi:MAG: pseudaminic acid synthase [Bacteroidota bacterium]